MLSMPFSMYGPVEIRSWPYLPGCPAKQFTTSAGWGAVASIDMRKRKSPVGWVRLKTIVLGLGVLMPEIVFALPEA